MNILKEKRIQEAVDKKQKAMQYALWYIENKVDKAADGNYLEWNRLRAVGDHWRRVDMVYYERNLKLGSTYAGSQDLVITSLHEKRHCVRLELNSFPMPLYPNSVTHTIAVINGECVTILIH